jgi:hypothetical protein
VSLAIKSEAAIRQAVSPLAGFLWQGTVGLESGWLDITFMGSLVKVTAALGKNWLNLVLTGSPLPLRA